MGPGLGGVDQIEELLSEHLVVERGELEGREKSERLSVVDLEGVEVVAAGRMVTHRFIDTSVETASARIGVGQTTHFERQTTDPGT
jgi:hypothetical protein